MSAEEHPLLRAVREEMEAALERLGQSPLFQARGDTIVNIQGNDVDIDALARHMALRITDYVGLDRADEQPKTVIVNLDDTLAFPERSPRGDIELPRLRNTLRNAARHAAIIDAYVRETDANSLSRGNRAKLHSTRRLAATLRDSLGQMAALLEGVDLDDEDEFDRWTDAEITLGGEFGGFDRTEIKLAEIYRMVKDMQRSMRSSDPTLYEAPIHNCELILKAIRNSDDDEPFNALLKEIRKFALMGHSVEDLRKAQQYHEIILEMIDQYTTPEVPKEEL